MVWFDAPSPSRARRFMKTITLHLLTLILAGNISAEQFQQVQVDYQLKGQNKSNTISISAYEGDVQPPVRGVMQNVGGPLKTFAYENNVALVARLDEGRGFSKELLKAAAEAAGRPEIEFAGSIVQGISKGGREAADWAAANQDRAIAVILDHSTIWSMDFPKRVSGVPMFFNATYADMFQNIDRRQSHFNWCTAAYKAGQPCTSIIDHVKNGGHGGRGSTDLTAIWLGEVINPLFPALRSGPTAASGASLQKQFPSNPKKSPSATAAPSSSKIPDSARRTPKTTAAKPILGMAGRMVMLPGNESQP